MRQVVDLIRKEFELKEQPAGEFSSFKVGPMKVSIEHWDGGSLGNVSKQYKVCLRDCNTVSH